jgi:hypothetical protein
MDVWTQTTVQNCHSGPAPGVLKISFHNHFGSEHTLLVTSQNENSNRKDQKLSRQNRSATLSLALPSAKIIVGASADTG